uniref:non-specific serine/threonine protein kinase n=1 Tax=Brassica oleracea var. oleracea TaxID=109376 RepID=A0A0D3AKC6_BRAOL
MNRPKVQRRVGKYEVGKTIGQGTFAKVRYAKNTETGESVALKILDKQKLLKNNKMSVQVLASKTKIYIVLEFAMGGELVDKIRHDGRLREDGARRYFQQLINAVDYCHSRGVYHRDLKPENLLLDSQGNLKISDFGLSALSRQAGGDGLLHTTCGTPNYAAPEITAAEYNCPYWLSLGAKNLIVRILDPNPTTRIKVPEILEDAWFKKDYKPAVFEEKEEAKLDDVDDVFKDSEEHHVTEKKEEQPTSMNAFELISMSRALDLGNLFEREEGFKRETRFAAIGGANELVQKIEAASKPLGFDIQKNNYKMRLENVNAGRKGNLEVATEIFQVSPSLHMVEVRKTKGDTLEFHKFYKKLSTTLKDVVWESGDTSDNNNK